MKQSPRLKIMFYDQQDCDEIVKALERANFEIFATSKPILDPTSDEWHIFLNLAKKAEPEKALTRKARV
jgi:hypothetical protein